MLTQTLIAITLVTLIAITLVTLIAAVILKAWLSYPKKLAPSLKEAEWTSNTGLNLSTVNMVKQPLNTLAVSHKVPLKRQVYPMGSSNRPIDFDDTSLLLASELILINQCDVVNIKKPNETQSCIQPAIPTYNVEAPAVCAPTTVYCAPIVEETKYHSTPSYDYGSHNSCSGHSSSSSDSSSSSSSSSSYGD
jgi:hypothetical protein